MDHDPAAAGSGISAWTTFRQMDLDRHVAVWFRRHPQVATEIADQGRERTRVDPGLVRRRLRENGFALVRGRRLGTGVPARSRLVFP